MDDYAKGMASVRSFIRMFDTDQRDWLVKLDRRTIQTLVKAVDAKIDSYIRRHAQPQLGLCSNREDHEPHVHESESLGTFWCHADQSQRLPYAAELRRKK